MRQVPTKLQLECCMESPLGQINIHAARKALHIDAQSPVECDSLKTPIMGRPFVIFIKCAVLCAVLY